MRISPCCSAINIRKPKTKNDETNKFIEIDFKFL